MNLTLTAEETELHHKACTLARQHRETEMSLCQVLREIGRTQLYLKLGHARLFTYAVEELKLTKAVAYASIAVARKTESISELKTAVDGKRLSVAKASRLVSCLTAENAAELIDYAVAHTFEEIDEELARRNPEKPKRDHSRPIGNDKVALSGQVSRTTHQMIKRAKSLLASKGIPTDLNGVLKESLDAWLDRHDPLRKAERAQARRTKAARCTEDGGPKSAGQEMAAQPEHARRARAAKRAEPGAIASAEPETAARPAQDTVTCDEQGANVCGEREAVTRVGPGAKACADQKAIVDSEEKLTTSRQSSSGTPGAPSPAKKVCVHRKTSMNHQAHVPSRQNRQAHPLSGGTRPARRNKRYRKTLKASTRHEVTLCTGDRCTFINERGERCTEVRWLHRHHIIPLSQGGSDEAENITLLCSAHHALVHQLSLPLEGQITWIRSPQVAYLA